MFPTPWGHRHGRHGRQAHRARSLPPSALAETPGFGRESAGGDAVGGCSNRWGNGAVMTGGIGEYFWGGFDGQFYFLSDGGDDAVQL